MTESSEPTRTIVVTPPVVEYSPLFQGRLADEIEANPLPPCHTQDGGDHCSAAKAAILDYGHLREQIRETQPE